MSKLPKLREICDFLGREPESKIYHYAGLNNWFYADKLNALYDALEKYETAYIVNEDELSGYDTFDFKFIDDILRDNRRHSSMLGEVLTMGDSLLYNMTKIAMGESRVAGYACYRLGCIYDKRESIYIGSDVNRSYRLAAYFYGQALQKGYTEDEVKIAYAEACAHLGWFDTALRWYPQDCQQYELVSAFLKHRIRFCKEHDVTFPKTENGFVCFEESKKASELKVTLLKILRDEKILVKKLEALEKCIPDSVRDITEKLDLQEEKILKKKKRSRIKWWLLFLLVFACASSGFLNGNGEGWQGISYKIFMTFYAPFGNTFTEGMNFVQRLASNLDDSARTTIAGAGMATHAILTFLWINFLKIFGKKKYAKMYASYKRKLYNTYKIEELLGQSDVLELVNKLDVTNIDGQEFKTPNDFAKHLHNLLVSNSRFAAIPSLYGGVAEHSSFQIGNELLDDYDAFVDITKCFKEESAYALLWSGAEMSSAYFDAAGYNKSVILDYFTSMYHSASALARKRGCGDGYHRKQVEKLVEALEKEQQREWQREFEREWDRNHPATSHSNSSQSSTSSDSGDGKNFDRMLNLWAHGAYGTDEEVFDELHRRGELSDYDYNRAKTYNWTLRDLDDDGT